MSMRPARTIVLLPSRTITTTGTGDAVINLEGYTAAIIRLTVPTPTGTSPTLNFRIQQGITDDNAAVNAGDQPPAEASITWDDFAAFAQATTSQVTRYIRIVGGGNAESASSSGALAAGTIRNGPLGSLWRAQWTIGGTNPSYAGVDCVVQLIP